MTAGFQAFTDTGIVQIDGSTPNYQLTQSLAQVTQQESVPTVYGATGQMYQTFWHTTFTFSASSPLFAFRGDGNVMVTPWRFSKNGNSYTAEFISAGQTTVRLYIFDQVPVTASHFGLQVFNASGALIADAANPFARVIDVIEGQYMPGQGFQAVGNAVPGPNTQSKTYGVNVAFAGCFPAHYPGVNSPYILSGLAASGGTITWEFHTYIGGSGGFVGFSESTYYRFMVMDMTGII